MVFAAVSLAGKNIVIQKFCSKTRALERSGFFAAKLSCIIAGMKKAKNTAPLPAAGRQSAVLDFIRRGQRAQAAVDRILREQPERRRTPRPKGHA